MNTNKVLIISFSFNQNEIVGSVRSRGLAKYLPKFGWEPTILTIKTDRQIDSDFRTIETDYLNLMASYKSKIGINPEQTFKNQFNIKNRKNKKGILDRVLELWVEIFAYPDGHKNWYEPAVNAGKKLLSEESFDVIISSSAPPTSHLIANELKKSFDIPWIADLRDLWTQNPYYSYSFIRKFFEKRLEIKTLANANLLTTISKPLENDLKVMHKGKRVYTICNGFDPDTEVKTESLNKKLNITYTGNLYFGKRDPEKLFKALDELRSENKIDITKFSVDFFGNDENWLQKDIVKYNLENIVNVHGIIPREKVLKKQRESQVLLLLTWDNPKEYGTVTGKIFEYLASNRPILSIGPSEGLVKKIITSTNSGVHLSDTDEIKKQICRFYDEFMMNGSVNYIGLHEEIKKYSQVRMSEKFAHLMNSLI